MFPLILKFLVENPWRTLFIVSLLVVVCMMVFIRVQWLRVDQAELDRDKAKMEVTKIETAGIVQQNKLDVASDELTRLRKRQSEDAKNLSDILKRWPQDCNEAAQTAGTILRARGDQ